MGLTSGPVSRDAIPSLLQPGVNAIAGTTGKRKPKALKKATKTKRKRG